MCALKYAIYSLLKLWSQPISYLLYDFDLIFLSVYSADKRTSQQTFALCKGKNERGERESETERERGREGGSGDRNCIVTCILVSKAKMITHNVYQ